MPAQDPCTIPLLANPFSPVEIAVGGPGTSTDNAVARWDGTGGNLIQDSGVTIDDSDNITTTGSLLVGDQVTILPSGTTSTLRTNSSDAVLNFVAARGTPGGCAFRFTTGTGVAFEITEALDALFSGDITATLGNVTLNAGDLTVTAGDAIITAGTLAVGTGTAASGEQIAHFVGNSGGDRGIFIENIGAGRATVEIINDGSATGQSVIRLGDAVDGDRWVLLTAASSDDFFIVDGSSGNTVLRIFNGATNTFELGGTVLCNLTVVEGDITATFGDLIVTLGNVDVAAGALIVGTPGDSVGVGDISAGTGSNNRLFFNASAPSLFLNGVIQIQDNAAIRRVILDPDYAGAGALPSIELRPLIGRTLVLASTGVAGEWTLTGSASGGIHNLTLDNPGAGNFNLILTDGNLTLSDGDLTVTAGDTLLGGDLSITGDVTSATCFTFVPTGTTPSTASLCVNPPSASANAFLLYLGVNDIEKASVDEDGHAKFTSIGVNATPSTTLGRIVFGNFLCMSRDVTNDRITIVGGTSVSQGARFQFFGPDHASTPSRAFADMTRMDFRTASAAPIILFEMETSPPRIRPQNTDSVALGLAGNRWADVFAVDANFSGSLVVGSDLTVNVGTTLLTETDTAKPVAHLAHNSAPVASREVLRLRAAFTSALSATHGGRQSMYLSDDGAPAIATFFDWESDDGTNNTGRLTIGVVNGGSEVDAIIIHPEGGIVTLSPLLALGGTPDAGGIPQWYEFPVSEADFTAASPTETITLLSLPAAGMIHDVKIKHTTAFSGGGTSGATLSVGIVGSTTKYAAAFDVFQAVGDTVFGLGSTFGSENHGAAVNIVVELDTTTGTENVVDYTAGAATIWVLISKAI